VQCRSARAARMKQGSGVSITRLISATAAALWVVACAPEDPGARARPEGGVPASPWDDGVLGYADPDKRSNTTEPDAALPFRTREPDSGTPSEEPDAYTPADTSPVEVENPPGCDPAPTPLACNTGLVRQARTDPQTNCVVGWTCVCPPPEQSEPPRCDVGEPMRLNNPAGCLLRYECRCPTEPNKPECTFDLTPRHDQDGCVVGWSCIDPTVCQHKEPSGIARNPGCDPDVIAHGLSTIGRVSDNIIYFTKGNKLWSLDTSGSGVFNYGVADLAAFLRDIPTDDGVDNPGDNAAVQSSGLDSFGLLNVGDEEVVNITKGTWWWKYDSARGVFASGNSDLPIALGKWEPQAGDPCPLLNPSCNAGVKQYGLTALDGSPAPGPHAWLMLHRNSYWIYDTSTWAFAQQGNIADYFLLFSPAGQSNCTLRSGDGTYLNAGCMPRIRAAGPSAIGEIQFLGKRGWLISSEKHFWHLDHTLNFVESGGDLAAFLRRVPTRAD
jgi:hypothetical protein